MEVENDTFFSEKKVLEEPSPTSIITGDQE